MKTALMLFGGTATVDPYWSSKFWTHVFNMEQQGELNEPVIRLLRGHGYVGNGTVTAPRVAELARGLEALDQAPPPAAGGTAGEPLLMPQRVGWGQPGAEVGSDAPPGHAEGCGGDLPIHEGRGMHLHT